VSNLRVGRRQFGLRTTFAVIGIIALGLAVWPLMAKTLPLLLYSVVASMAVGLLGLGTIVLSGLMALTIAATDDDGDRQKELSRCLILACLGGICCVPCIVAFLLLTFRGYP
jgi:hypothetical protein